MKPIHILGIPWKVHYIDPSLEMFGRSVHQFNRIELKTDATREQLRETALHEIIHAAASSVLTDHPDEEIIKPLARALWCTLRDNPEWTDFITGRAYHIPDEEE